MRLLFTLACFLFLFEIVAQPTASNAVAAPKKEMKAQKATQAIKIDGEMSESDWQNSAVASDFMCRWPFVDKLADQKTEVRVLYDDYALYIFAYCYDNKDSVSRPLNKRDVLDNSDWFGIIIDTYQDCQNAVEFDVMVANVQYDSKYSVSGSDSNNGNGDGEDTSWDGVWLSATKVVADGYCVEMEIPYSAIRFPKKDVQNWNINFWRQHNKSGQQHSWNQTLPTQRSLVQAGVLTGIENIKTPVRLSATPFVASSATNSYNKSANPASIWNSQFSAGLDLKYGINDAFTLDATIIPDFAQVRSDNRVLNISPYEVRFNEFRPFFMEGTELFNKGGLFYSRRIGGTPNHYWDAYDGLSDDEEVVNNPASTQLINAIKVSGRTNGGTGIGIFNAVEAPMFATVENKVTRQTRQVQTSYLTDKSVIVIDQNLKNNSYVTFINTSAMRRGGDRDATVTGLNFALKDKKNIYTVSGRANVSQIFENGKVDRGNNLSLVVEKTAGKFNWHAEANQETNNYNPNDLGYLNAPNERSALGWVSWNEFKPNEKLKLNNWWASTFVWMGQTYLPRAWNSVEFGGNIGANTKSFHNFGMNINITPFGGNDYFEPRTPDNSRYFQSPARYNINYWYNSDRRKNWQVYNGCSFGFREGYGGRKGIYPWTGFSLRIGKKFTTGADINIEYSKRDVGFAFPYAFEESVGYQSLLDTTGNQDPSNIVFSRRDIFGFDNGVQFGYTFNNKMNLNIRARHYWNQIRFTDFYLLNEDGTLGETAYTGRNEDGKNLHNITANYFNVDCFFTWRFAPGSDFILIWKQSIFNEQDVATQNYWRGARDITALPQTNTFSMKILYWLDYTQVKRRIK